MPRLEQSGSFLGPTLTVLSANIEGFSTAKQQTLENILKIDSMFFFQPVQYHSKLVMACLEYR